MGSFYFIGHWASHLLLRKSDRPDQYMDRQYFSPRFPLPANALLLIYAPEGEKLTEIG